MEARRAHNPEVVGSSPASATKKVLKSKDFRTFSCVLWTEKSREIFCKSAETLLTHILTHNRIVPYGQSSIFQNTMSTKSENPLNFQNFLKRKSYDLRVFARCSIPLHMPITGTGRGFTCLFRFDMCCLTIQIRVARRNY